MPKTNPRLENLSSGLLSLPKLDKSQFISSYIQQQKAYAKFYASEGRAFVLSWNEAALPDGPGVEVPRSPALKEYGFDTPILKPRVVTVKPSEHASPQDHPTRKRPKVPSPREVNKRKRSDTGTSHCMPRRLRQPKSTKVDENAIPVDHERLNRLGERRERRQAKRAIIKPAENEDEAGPKARSTKNKKDNVKMSAGFALMHGFSATNIGSNRLTVKYPGGVFNRGKASAKIQINNKRLPKNKGHQTAEFSEAAFLGGPRPGEFERVLKINSLHPSASETSTYSQLTTESALVLENEGKKDVENSGVSHCEAIKKLHDRNISEKKETGAGGTDPSEAEATPDEPEGAKSIIWDIELDDVSLPSQANLSNLGQQTVILDTLNFPWADSHIPEPQINTYEQALAPLTNGSICPSQSASQCGHPRTSKYFAAAHMETAPSLSTKRSPSKYPTEDEVIPGTIDPLDIMTSDYALSEAPGIDTGVQPEYGRLEISPLLLDPQASESEGNIGTDAYAITDEKYASSVPNLAPQDSSSPVVWAPTHYFNQPVTICEFLSHKDEYDVAYSDLDGYLNLASTNLQATQEYNPNTMEDMEVDYSELSSIWPNHSMDVTPFVLECMGGETIDPCHDWGAAGIGYCETLYNSDQYESLGPNSEGECEGWHFNDEFPIVPDASSVTKSASSGEYIIEADSSVGSEIVCGSPCPFQFSQGRALLLGYDENVRSHLGLGVGGSRSYVSLVEADVAKRLRNHWLPHRL